ncbi:MAG: LamG domain-containing protein [Planctomycetota bacterium]
MYAGTHQRLATSAIVALLVIASICIGSPARAQSTANLPFSDGDIITTHFGGFNSPGDPLSGLDADGPVVSLIDASIPAIFPNPTPTPGVLWPAPIFNNLGAAATEQWLARNLGQVFGLCTDNNGVTPNIYVAATGAYGDWSAFPFPMGGVGPDGSGAIYQIDGATGDINSFVVTGPGGVGTNQIPNGGSGLGNVCYDPTHGQFFATNFEDGLIYRIDNTGIILSTYDPFAPTIPVPGGFAPLGDRPFAVAFYGGRLYFSGWLRDTARPTTNWPPSWGPLPPQPTNSIFSIAIDATSGNFVGTEQLEIVLPYLPPNQFSNPVSDIEFTVAGDMLLGERTYVGDFGMIDTGHQARCLEYVFSGTAWVPSTEEFFIGDPPASGFPPSNCAGGVDYDCLDNVWSSGNLILPAAHGFVLMPNTGNTPATSFSANYEIGLPNGVKAGPGDVERFQRDCGCLPPYAVSCVLEAATNVMSLTWTNGQSYSAIEVRCGGITIASLPGNATTYSFLATPPTAPCCEIVGLVPSINPSLPPTECASEECCVNPCVPPSGLTCDYDPAAAIMVLNWTNGQVYDQIEVECDGVIVATLSGTATTYGHPVPAGSVVCCKVFGVILGPPGTVPTRCESVECCSECLPPFDVTCVWDPVTLGTVISWTNGQAYDQIHIECDGVIVAALSGTATSYTHILNPPLPGSQCYRVIGVLNNPDGTHTECPSEVCCTGCDAPVNVFCELINMQLVLNWTNSSAYDAINVICNGVLVATLPGTATSYASAPPPSGQVCCQIVGIINGLPGTPPTECPSVECCLGCLPPINVFCFEDPLVAGTQINWTNGQTYSSINIECNGVVVATLPGTATSHLHVATPPVPGEVCYRVIGILVNSDGTTTECPSEECCIGCDAPTNLFCELINMQLVLNWTNAPGGYDAVHVYCNGVLEAVLGGNVTSYTSPTPPPSGQVCCYVVGVINAGPVGFPTECPSVECCIGCEPPTNLTCGTNAAGLLSMTWTNPGGYDQIEVYCNGLLFAILPGTATSHAGSILPPGQVCCQVVGIINGPAGTAPTLCPSEECCIGCEPPTNLTCGTNAAGLLSMTWTNPGGFDQIEVYCNGLLFAILPGTATSHAGAILPPGQVCCQVVGIINGPAGTAPTLCPSEECCLGCSAPENLVCEVDPATNTVYVNWTNPQVYSSIQVWCDGVQVASMLGTATNYAHTTAGPGDTVCCWVVGVIVNSDGTTTECTDGECCVTIPNEGPCPYEDVAVLLNTGYDDGSSSVIGVGNPDDDWIVIADRDLSNNATVPPFSTTPEPVPAEVRTTHAAWSGPLVGPGATGSAWVYHSINAQNGYFDYQRCFCLREGFSNAVLSFEILADDQADVFLNGTLIYSTSPSAFVTPESHVEVDQSLFIEGENCIMVTVANTFGVATGFNFVGEVTATNGKCCCTPAPHGMVGWWPLDLEDNMSGGTDIAWGNDGSVVIPDFQPGMVAEALFFNGSNQVIVPDHPRLDFGPPTGIAVGDFSIDAWIRLDNAIDGPHPIVSKFGTGGGTPGYIFYVDTTGNLAFIVQDSSIASQYAPTSAGAFVNDGQWHHVAVTYDRDRTGNGVRLFVDGQRVDPDTYDGTAMGDLSNAGPLRIGGADFFGGVSFEGHIDEVEIFDRALLGSEVRRLYEAGDSGKCKEYCHVPWDKPVASNGTTTVNVVVCNDGGTTQTYNVSALPHSGPGCSLPSPGVGIPATVSVPPSSCITVPVSISAPTGPGLACYKVCFENILTGHRFCCTGSMKVGSPIIVISDDDIIAVPVGTSTPITFTLDNPTPAAVTSTYRVVGMTMNPAVKTISLDGLPPGEPVIGTLSVSGNGGSTDVTVEAAVLDHEPFVFYDIILMVDFDGDGIEEAEASAMLRTTAAAPAREFKRGDCNLDNGFDIGDPVFLLGYLFSGGAVPGCPDSCDANDDGNLNIGDAIYKLSHLFAGGAAPPAPFGTCGPDPTSDSLGACVDPNCP